MLRLKAIRATRRDRRSGEGFFEATTNRHLRMIYVDPTERRSDLVLITDEDPSLITRKDFHSWPDKKESFQRAATTCCTLRCNTFVVVAISRELCTTACTRKLFRSKLNARARAKCRIFLPPFRERSREIDTSAVSRDKNFVSSSRSSRWKRMACAPLARAGKGRERAEKLQPLARGTVRRPTWKRKSACTFVFTFLFPELSRNRSWYLRLGSFSKIRSRFRFM